VSHASESKTMSVPKAASALFLVLILGVLSAATLPPRVAEAQQPAAWSRWLDEVDPIITRTERSVFLGLKTEEDRRRFQELFWKARNPHPRSASNDFQTEYYRRRTYAGHKLGGPASDRGRIYILLGEPAEKRDYSGEEDVYDCQLWNYDGLKRGTLPAFVHLIFFKSGNMGDYKLFVPGVHSAVDLINPSRTKSATAAYQAYQLLLMSYPELARATLSVVPGEGDPVSGSGTNSSSMVLGQIYSLPEKEVPQGYIQSILSPTGNVDVSYSTKPVGGKGCLAVSAERGLKFLSYALLPAAIATTDIADHLHSAAISLNLRIEDLSGKTIFQQEKKLDLKIDDRQKQAMLEDGQLVFKDFAPIIDGDFNVIATYTNRTMNEFFVYSEKIRTSEKTLPVILGYGIQGLDFGSFLPFSAGRQKVLVDPRLVFGPGDVLAGFVFSAARPEIRLTNLDDSKEIFDVNDIAAQEGRFLFRLPLKALASGNYTLTVRAGAGETFSRTISVLPYEVKKPQDFEWSDPPGSEYNYFFLLGQQLLNSGDAETALRQFEKLPPALWNATSLPIIGRAYFLKQDYAKVVELLESGKAEMNHPVLSLLAQSHSRLGHWPSAAAYYEKLRKYGDTAEISRTLARIYETMGEKDKAAACRERAQALEKKQSGGCP
jgi:GWxTD domain-containing protein